MSEATLLGALLLGLMGSAHCLGMCGGLAAMTGQGVGGLSRVVIYNLGRLTTYALLGALAGWFGEQILAAAPKFTLILRGAAGLLLIAMGLYVTGWWMGLSYLERGGAYIWRYLQPFTRRLLPVEHAGQALLLGLIWGLLPCGLVYSTISWALVTADWRQSALLMLSFGIGTLPAMVGLGVLHGAVVSKLKSRRFRSVAGIFIILMGLWTIVLPLQHASHHSHAMMQESNQNSPPDEHMHHH